MINFIAHRGFQKEYPENTLLSISSAIECGAELIEFDIQFSLDREAILYHDETLDRVSGISGNVNKILLKDLLKTRAYEPERLGDLFYENKITSLDSIIPIIKENKSILFFIEVKEESFSYLSKNFILKYLKHKLKNLYNVCIISHDLHFLKLINLDFIMKGAVVWEKSEIPLGFDFIFYDLNYIQYLKEIPKNLVVYEVGNKEEAEHLYQMGINYIETFNIKEMLK